MTQKKPQRTTQKSKRTVKNGSSSHTSASRRKASSTARQKPAAKKTAASRTKKQNRKPRLRMGRVVMLVLACALILGGGAYATVHFQLFSRFQDALGGDRTAAQTNVRHDREIAAIKKKNALDTVDGVSAFSDDELRECFFSSEIDDKIAGRLKNMGYTDQIPLDDLRYVRVLFYDFDGKTEVGELVVNKEIATKVENVFYDLYMHRYPIQKMILPDAYGTRIAESFADNNTVALCFGLSEDSSGEEHEMGLAIDLNPLYNPLIKDNGSSLSVFPMEGQLYLDRTIQGAHYIYKKDYAVTAFEKEGFVWKGDETGTNDYKHFEYPISGIHHDDDKKDSSSHAGAAPESQPQTDDNQAAPEQTPQQTPEETVPDQPAQDVPVEEPVVPADPVNPPEEVIPDQPVDDTPIQDDPNLTPPDEGFVPDAPVPDA